MEKLEKDVIPERNFRTPFKSCISIDIEKIINMIFKIIFNIAFKVKFKVILVMLLIILASCKRKGDKLEIGEYIEAGKYVEEEGKKASSSGEGEKESNIGREGRITLASFNTLRLGEKEKDYRALAQIIAPFDLTGLQEVMHEKGLKKLKGHLEKLTKEKWEYIISESSAGSEGYREYYGFIYRKKKFSEVRPLGFYNEKDENEFMREPYGAYFKAGSFDFIYVIAHSIFGDKEKQRLIEAGNYVKVYRYFLDMGKKDMVEDDIIIAGDFNVPADSIAFRRLKEEEGVDYLLEPKDNPTTISEKGLVSSYDNFFINRDRTEEFTGKTGVFNFVKNNNYGIIKKYISDHLLIFSEYASVIE